MHERPFGGNWGDWQCVSPGCRFAYCQDCGAPINQLTGQCMDYEEMQDGNEDQS